RWRWPGWRSGRRPQALRGEDVIMTGSFRVRCAAILVAMLAWPALGAGGPGEARALNSQLKPARGSLEKNEEKILTNDQETLLQHVACASAAAGGCPGFTIDRDKFKQGFESFKTDDYMKLPAEEKRKFDYRLMMNYGAAVALYTAEGLLHPKQ